VAKQVGEKAIAGPGQSPPPAAALPAPPPLPGQNNTPLPAAQPGQNNLPPEV
jgi:hypothetical protein